MISRIILIFIVFSSLKSLSAQTTSDYFIKQTKDTVFCTDLKYGTSTWGAINYLSYTQKDGSPIKYQSKKSAPLILTLYKDGKTIDRIPLKPNSKRDVIYLERKVDGPLKIYLQHQNSSYSSKGTVMYIFYLKMPDGKIYKINDRENMEEIIIPYLKECSAFVSAYNGDYSNKEEAFIEMIRQYNSLCSEQE